MNTENITRVRWLDLNTVLYSGSAYQSQGSSAAGHWIKRSTHLKESVFPKAKTAGNTDFFRYVHFIYCVYECQKNIILNINTQI